VKPGFGSGWDGLPAVLLCWGSSVPQAMAMIDTLHGQQGVLIDILRWLTSLLPQDRTLYTVLVHWLQFDGVSNAAADDLQELGISQDLPEGVQILRRCERHLAGARAAAATGQWTSMIIFPQIVSSMLLEGVQEWASGDEIFDCWRI
jgi:hypothetical protein